MGFRDWLETAEEPVFTVFASDGTIVCYIGNKRYVFRTDAVYHHRWKSHLKANYPGSAWKVFNQVKQAGKQIEPPPEDKPQPEKTFWD